MADNTIIHYFPLNVHPNIYVNSFEMMLKSRIDLICLFGALPSILLELFQGMLMLWLQVAVRNNSCYSNLISKLTASISPIN